MNAHIDVVEADDKDFTPKIEGDKLLGRGSVDMKAGAAASMLLMKEFKDKKPDMALMIVSDEEIGGFDGTGHLVKQGYTADFVMAAEPGHDANKLDICIKEKGVFWVKIKTKGKACHGSRPWLGENAAEKLFNKYFEIKKLFTPTTPEDRWKTTVNLGKVNSGNSPNRVPDEAEMVLDIRYTEETSASELFDKIKQIQDIEVEVIEEAPMLINKDMTMINKLKKVVENVTGKECPLMSEHGASDLRFFSEKEVPSAIIGPFGENYHGDGEFVLISSLELFYKVMVEFVNTLT